MWKDELINSVYRQIEIAGRTCYKSEDKITETSAKEFVDRMVKSGHGAMLEHGTVYLKVPNSVVDEGFQFGTNWSTLCLNPYTRYISDGDYYYYTTNYRVIIEHDLQEFLNICVNLQNITRRESLLSLYAIEAYPMNLYATVYLALPKKVPDIVTTLRISSITRLLSFYHVGRTV